MSIFKVSLEKISRVRNHPNADRLDICKVEDMSFQFVTGRDQFKEGDVVLYFPVDAVLPPNILEILGLTGKLAGQDRNRIKTITLRGEISQGVVAEVAKFEHIMFLDGNNNTADALRITKYEAPVVPCHNADLVGLPEGLSVYDIEGCDRFQHIVDAMLDMNVVITEKLEGANFSVTALPSGELFVNQRNYSIRPKDGMVHDFWKVAESQGLIDLAKKYAKFHDEQCTIYGEFLGPGYQGNIYKLAKHEVRVFDIKMQKRFIDACAILDTHNHVPVIAKDITLRDWLNGRSIQEAVHGVSALADVLREGIVIKPHIEFVEASFGRVVLKQRDPIYLSKNEN